MANISLGERLLGKKVNGVRVTPISLKIVAVFIVFLLLSNLVSNFINLTLNRSEQIKLTNTLLVRDLKDLYIFVNNQYKQYMDLGRDKEVFLKQMVEFATVQFGDPEKTGKRKSLALAVNEDGSILFQAGGGIKQTSFGNDDVLKGLLDGIAVQADGKSTKEDGSLEFTWNGETYFGVYRHTDNWRSFLIRAEERNEFNAPTVQTFIQVSIFISILTVIFVIIGTFLIRYILRFVSFITKQVMEMQKDKRFDPFDLRGAPNDEITYLGVSLNTLSTTITNLLEIFKKFVTREVALNAYKEGEIRLKGEPRELAIIFSDIKSFTFMTETLGTDIITLLNIHYNRAINLIHKEQGDIGSIIGDALLAIFGTIPGENKSLQAIRAGYEVIAVADLLKEEMQKRHDMLIRTRGYLTDAEQNVFKAVLLEVGVGIDGGRVFYGNIGSNERMVNTVIGDNVNSASRLEGLTRVYKVPMVVSEYIRDETLRSTRDYHFLELDMVQVKGKTVGKRIYYPVPLTQMTPDFRQEMDVYARALVAYYEGRWKEALSDFSSLKFKAAAVFVERLRGQTAPSNWTGVWAMTDK